MRLPIFICLCLAIASIRASTLDKDRACVLTKKDFDNGLQGLQGFGFYGFNSVLVEFYNQKCHHCDDLGSNLFNILENSKWPVGIKTCTVDVSIQKEIADDYQIKETSTLKLFYNGGSAPVTYEGIESVVEILNWLKRVSIALDEVKSIHDAQSLINNNQAVAFFFGHVRSDAFNSFLSTASLCGNVTLVHSNRESLKNKYQITMDLTLVLFEEFGTKKSVKTQDFEKKAIRKFISNNNSLIDIIHTFDENNYQNILNGLAALILITSDSEEGMNALKALEAASPDLMSQIALLLVKPDNEYFDELTDFFGINVESLPVIRILTEFPKKEKFGLEGEITPESIKAFVKDFKDKKLQPYLRSEPIPQNPYDNDGVRIVVRKNFEEVVFDENKDVLVVYYSSLEPGCSDLALISSSLIQRLHNVKDIVVAKMDIGTNEIERPRPFQSHCSFMVYPKGNKHNPLFYDGESTEDALFDFLINAPSAILSFDDLNAFHEEFKALVVLADDDETGIKAQESLKTISVGLREKIALYIAKPSDPFYRPRIDLFGITEDSLPAVKILQGKYPPKKYALEKEITPENLEIFVEDFLSGKLKPYYRSEPVPENPYDENGIRIVVGKNFEEVVLDENNDVLIAYETDVTYSDLIFDLSSLSHKLKNVTGIVIAKMNASANEIEELNTGQYKHSLVLYPKNDKQNPLIYNRSSSNYPNKEQEYLMDFLRKHSSADIPEDPRVSVILPFSKEVMDDISLGGQTALVMIISDDETGVRAEEALKAASADFKGEMLLILAKEHDDLINKLVEMCAISMDNIPTVLIVQHPKHDYCYHLKKFVLEGEITPENLKTFVEDFKNNKLQRYYKSAPIPDNSYDENGVRIVVGKNFHEVVYDENNDVLIAAYHSNCPHCIAPIFDLPSRLANVTNIVIAKVDIDTNEIDGLKSIYGECNPTLLYSRGAKQNPFYYDPDNHGDIIDFLKENTNLDIPVGQESSTIVPYDRTTVWKRALHGLETLILITNDDEAGAKAEEALRTASSDFRGELIFSLAKIDANKSESSSRFLAQDLYVPLDSLPVIRIVKGEGSSPPFRVRRYAFVGEITPENLKRFIQDFQNGKLKPYESIQENLYKNYDEL